MIKHEGIVLLNKFHRVLVVSVKSINCLYYKVLVLKDIGYFIKGCQGVSLGGINCFTIRYYL